MIKKRSSRGCGRKWGCSVSSKVCGKARKRKECKREEEVVFKKIVRWRLRRKRIARKSWMSKKKSLQRQLLDIEKFANMDPVFRDRHKEKRKEELQEIESKRTELLPEHQKMQKRSQKLQSMQDKKKKKKCFKDACACEGATQLLHQEMEVRKTFFETRVRALSEKSADCRKAAADLDVEIQALQAGEERRGSSASQSNRCCFDPATWEQVFAYGETQAESFIQSTQQEFDRRYKTPGALEQGAGGEEKEAWEGDWDDEKAPSGWYGGATVDPDRCQDSIGGSCGGGNPSTPRNGTHARDSSRSPRGKHGKMEDDGLL